MTLSERTLQQTSGDLISVIVPVFNSAYYLKKCVGSILRQTYRHLEIILVDDGSTDDSGKICDRFAAMDSRVRVIHQFNGGASSARNAGLKLAAGKYVVFSDADDWMPETAVEELHRGITFHRESDICMGASVMMGSLAQTVVGPQKCMTFRKGDIDAYLEFMHYLTDGGGICVWGKLFRMSVIADNGLSFDEDIHYGEDTLFLLTFLLHSHTLSTINRVVYHYSLLSKGNACKKYYPELNLWQKCMMNAFDELLKDEQRQYSSAKQFALNHYLSRIRYSCELHISFLSRKEATAQIRELFIQMDEIIKRITTAIDRGEISSDQFASGWFIPYLYKKDEASINKVYDICLRRHRIRRKIRQLLCSVLDPVFRLAVYQFNADSILLKISRKDRKH